ncbi:MAG: hypothetical protein HC866_00790 [Leptolyngbyaceae cyanobacterium RU_5_1]|nr:hypothetical protein [Leptolyngbyaceae cyanobacterium RU_5_1]
MTESSSVRNPCLVKDDVCSEGADAGVLVAELEQARSLEHGQRERIHHLEQALDQSLASLEELRLQLVDQQFLETQLASTEEFANIQQRAITQLKQQLAQQQQALDAQQTQSQEQQQSFQELLAIVEDLAQGQQIKLGHLRIQIHSDRGDTQTQKAYLKKIIN